MLKVLMFIMLVVLLTGMLMTLAWYMDRHNTREFILEKEREERADKVVEYIEEQEK